MVDGLRESEFGAVKKAWMLTFLCFAEKDPDAVENWQLSEGI